MSVHERELKFAAPPAVTLPPLSDPLAGVVAEPSEIQHLLATYYDTSDLRLARTGASLRHRNDEGWAVKLPKRVGRDGFLSRSTFSFDGGDSAPPPDALDLVRALTRAADVEPVAQLRTIRRAVSLRTTHGTPIGEVVDDHVTVVGGDAPVRAFRELELEVADDAPEAQTVAIVARLRAAGVGAPDPTPKIVRALGPRAAAPPDVAAPLGPARTVHDVVADALAAAVTKLIAHDPGVRRGDDPEELHQARVATRRLRSHLRTFRPLVDRPWADALRDELQWLGGALGAVRDADVLLERLGHRAESLPDSDRVAAEPLFDRLRAQRCRARDELLVAMRSARYTELLERLVQAVRRPRLLLRVDDDPDELMLRRLVRRPWQQLCDAVETLPDDPPDEALHAIRKAAKRARYAAEAVEPAFGKPARAFANAVTEIQDVLGEHQDAVVTARWLRENAAEVRDERATFAAGQLAAIEHDAARAARDAWPDVWRRASHRKRRRWL